ncbi:hypothetical protein [Pelagibius sp.]|uniref:hypothetical protein n=1 Tax=Pelagibius sp. TaxID=1931238 RepID=UPI00260178E2|nr:hypothetical protein [Pelagibius sp.]
MYYETFEGTDAFWSALGDFAEAQPGHGERILKCLKDFQKRRAGVATVLRSRGDRAFHLLPETEDAGQWMLLIEVDRETSGRRIVNTARGHRFARYGTARQRAKIVDDLTAYAERLLGI